MKSKFNESFRIYIPDLHPLKDAMIKSIPSYFGLFKIGGVLGPN